MKLEEAVYKVIRELNAKVFDSHVVINEIRNKPEYSEIYIHEIKENETIKNYHKRIACIIRDSGLVAAVQHNGEDLLISSKNIHGNLTSNHVWEKK